MTHSLGGHTHPQQSGTMIVKLIVSICILVFLPPTLAELPTPSSSDIQKDANNNKVGLGAIDSASIHKMFHTNHNSIIRTHDSRVLGALFLNSTMMNCNEDCLLFCWNVSNCNLAVFEGKEKGTCYLFDCGVPENFKCRFTPHESYTSSVLHVNRNSYLLQQWKTQADAKQDKPTTEREAPHAASHLDANDNKQLTVTSTQASKCRHYQFECRNSSECIAIYNVCDGIAQCNDGSDEGPELECHKSRLTTPTKPPAPAETSTMDLSPFREHSGKSMIPYSDTVKSSEEWLKLNPPNYFNYPRSANEEGNAFYKPQGVPDYSSYANWNPFLANNEIGNNKQGLQTENERYAKEASVYWPSLAYSLNDQQQQQLRPRQFDQGFVSPLNFENRLGGDYPMLLTPKNDNSKAPVLSAPSKEDPSPAVAPASNASTTDNKTSPSKANYSHISQSRVNIENRMGVVSVLHDVNNESGRETNSAVIALTLGLFITTILIVLVGCRMKTFKKRIARRGRSLAHDADYLVNGMHL